MSISHPESELIQGDALAAFLRTEPWENMSYQASEAVQLASGLLWPMERKMLSWLASHVYRGAGEIVDLGAFIGASALALASGLAQNPSIPDKTGRIHSFDRFNGEWEGNWIRERTVYSTAPDGSFLHIHASQTKAFRDLITVYQGDLLSGARWIGKPIEILFIDVLKSPELASAIVPAFFPHLVPGRTIAVMQDYLYEELPYTVVTMEHFSDYFTYAGDTGRGSCLFVLRAPIPAAVIADFAWHRIPKEQRLMYLIRAAARQRTYLGQEIMAHLIRDFVAGRFC